MTPDTILIEGYAHFPPRHPVQAGQVPTLSQGVDVSPSYGDGWITCEGLGDLDLSYDVEILSVLTPADIVARYVLLALDDGTSAWWREWSDENGRNAHFGVVPLPRSGPGEAAADWHRRLVGWEQTPPQVPAPKKRGRPRKGPEPLSVTLRTRLTATDADLLDRFRGSMSRGEAVRKLTLKALHALRDQHST